MTDSTYRVSCAFCGESFWGSTRAVAVNQAMQHETKEHVPPRKKPSK